MTDSSYGPVPPGADGALLRTPGDVLGLKTDTAIAVKDDTSGAMRYLKGLMDAVGGTSGSRLAGKAQTFEKSITSAANAGDVTVATVTTQPCLIESIVVHADAAQTGDLTSAGMFGGAGKVITFIPAADALQADLDAADKQIAWTGAVRLAAGKTIVISLDGTGATAVDLTVSIKYRAAADAGYLA